ncbi:MAG: hypothetical protein CSA24_02290 [Deltaproteobacteria bacterium]|nr:MAG: hypothetical protein CSA24_02290 [Deltaproteobacteria bacterium]
MPILNPSFEDAGAHPGEAEHWILQAFTGLRRIAGFGPAPHRSWEDFERWFALTHDLDGIPVAIAFFDPLAEGVEDFEEVWDNDLYLNELPTGQVVTAAFGGGAGEDMKDGWSNAPYATTWADVGGVIGLFDAEPREGFEEGWRSNESYAWSWADMVGVIAAFDGGADTDEDFENDWTAAATI